MAKAELSRRVNDRVDAVLNLLISKQRTAHGISGDEAKAGIAEISGLRLLLTELEADIRKGGEARERLVGAQR